MQNPGNLQAWLNLSKPEEFAALHAVGEGHPDLGIAWSLASRLMGLRPVIVPLKADLEKLNPMTEGDACKLYGVPPEEFGMHMDWLQLAWEKWRAANDLPEVFEATDKKVTRKVDEFRHDFTQEEIDILSLGRFSTTIFDTNQSETDRNQEIAWFIERVSEVRRVFEDTMTSALARMALHNELQARRVNDKLVAMDPTEREYKTLQDLKSKIEHDYMAQWAQIKEIAPGISISMERKAQITHISSLIKQYLDMKADPAERLRDGVFTDEEFQVMLRASQQFDPRYRLGWVVAVNEARMGINDPRWKRRLPPEYCRLLDTSMSFALRKLTERLKLHRPDLTGDGKANEYLPIVSDEIGEITQPEEELLEDEVASVTIQEPPKVELPA